MSLPTGSRLGPYEVLSAIGAGGMGEVYRATDTRLKRDVALKILPQSFATDPERRARFQREAEVLASLNHQHIAQIYGIEESNGTSALVMELVEGETLADRISRGAIPVDEALPIAKQIAEALEAAHEQGIIHRDLKPANIKLRSDGTVKVLDFGLAKLVEAPPASAGNPSMSLSPTITSPALLSGIGVVLGTAAYMSPEQAKGRPADNRSDVWAFGCVLYEMLTGRRAFEGDDVADTLASVLRAQPDWHSLPAELPAPIAALLSQSLQKDRHQRVSNIAAASFALRMGASVPVATPARTIARRRAIPLVITGVVCAAIAAATTWRLKPPVPTSLGRFEILLASGQEFSPAAASRGLIAMSPDGSQIAYVGNSGLYTRPITSLAARRLVSTDDQQAIQNPVFSPDGKSIAFYSVFDRAFKRVSVSGGAAATLYSSEAANGIEWSEDGLIFALGRAGVMRLGPDGGRPTTLVTVRPGEVLVEPQLLPGGQAVLFTVADSSGALDFDRARIALQSLRDGERKVLIEGGSDARYLKTGHIVFARGGGLWAVPFDLSRLAVTGSPVSIVEGVARGIGVFGLATSQYDVSENGTLAYVPGPELISTARRSLVSIDHQGTVTPLRLPAAPYISPRVAPDGSKLAVVTDDGKDVDLWVCDLGGGNSLRRLTFGGVNRFPVWSADSRHLVFQSNRGGDAGIWWQLADGSRPPERLTTAPSNVAHVPESWVGHEAFSYSAYPMSSIGRAEGAAGASLWIFSMEKRKGESFGDLRSAAPFDSAVSPDGHWMAYTLRGPGRAATYVQPIPPTGARYQIADPGHHPLWSPDGRELQYFPASGRLLGVHITTVPAFSAGAPFPVPGGFTSNTSQESGRNHDFAPDGRMIAALSPVEIEGNTGGAQHIEVVLNWLEELKRLVPTK